MKIFQIPKLPNIFFAFEVGTYNFKKVRFFCWKYHRKINQQLFFDVWCMKTFCYLSENLFLDVFCSFWILYFKRANYRSTYYCDKKSKKRSVFLIQFIWINYSIFLISRRHISQKLVENIWNLRFLINRNY